VSTGNLNKAVKRNAKRFPEDFMFQLSKEEYDAIRFQFGTLKRGQHPKYLPHVFTEHRVAMLSSVLNSERAVKINIQIIRAFIRLRELLATNQELSRKIKEMEKKYDALFLSVFARLDSFTAIEPPAKGKIGFVPPSTGKRKK
jgi:ORF6N domain